MYFEYEDRFFVGFMTTWMFFLPGLVGSLSPLIHAEDYHAWWYIPFRVGSVLLVSLALWIYWSIYKSIKADTSK